MVAMENFEKCTVAMLGGPCMQHVTGNKSRLNQPQSAIMWGTSGNSLALILKTTNLFLPCKLIFWKATKVGSPPNFPKLMSQLWGIQLWGIPQRQYFVTSLSEPHWTYFWKHCIYHKEDTKVGSQIFGYQIWFCTRLLIVFAGVAAVQCCYKAVNFQNRYPTARPHRRATIKCFLSTRSDLHPTSVTAVIYVIHHVIWDRVITAPNCILRQHHVTVIDLSHNSHNASDTTHNAPFCNRNVHISVTKWCIVGYVSNA